MWERRVGDDGFGGEGRLIGEGDGLEKRIWARRQVEKAALEPGRVTN